MNEGDPRSQVPLAEQTSFRIGGVPSQFVELACDAQSVVDAAPDLRADKIFMLGGGTNVLAADDGYPGTIVRFDDQRRIERLDNRRYRVSANTEFDELVSRTCEAGLYGVERLAGIPGSVGGAVVQNAGAYHQELAHTLESVVYVDRDTAEVVTRTKDDCLLAYRDSMFKRSSGSKMIIVECVLQLSEHLKDLDDKGLVEELERRDDGRDPDRSPQFISEAVRAVRDGKDHLLQEDNPSAGSFFKNPRAIEPQTHVAAVVSTFEQRRDALIASGADWITPATKVVREHSNGVVELIAGLLIATANDPERPELAYSPARSLGPLRLGRGGANTIINANAATAADVLALASDMRRLVSDAYGLLLECEVVLLGDIALK